MARMESIRRNAFATAALLAGLLIGGLLIGAGPLAAQSRIKDIADFEGVRDNQLVGYGLVVGLNGTGDDLDSAVFTRESLIGMLQRLGVNARDDDLDTDNVAAVMVTAEPAALLAARAPGSTSRSRRSATPRACSAAPLW